MNIWFHGFIVSCFDVKLCDEKPYDDGVVLFYD